MKSKSGFTLIELLVAIAIFSVVIVFFITMFLAITRVQVQQSSLAEVNGQSQFLLQEMQYYIGQSSLIDMPQDVATTTLALRMPEAAQDPIYITLSSGTLYLQQAGGALQPLSSDKVAVSGLTFTKHSNPPGHDSVSISFTVAYNTSNIEQLFSEMFQTSVARVSAATFDSDLVPSSTATYSLGVAGQVWNSINGLIYFNGNNVGIGSAYSSPQQTLDVQGGVRLNNQGAAQPACSTSQRGTLWFIEQAPAMADSFQVCGENSAGSYQWSPVGVSQWLNGASGTIYYSSGNVGIGTTGPDQKLTVYGNMDIGNSGQITVPNGTYAVPSYSFSSQSGTGMSWDGYSLGFSVSGTRMAALNAGGLNLLGSNGNLSVDGTGNSYIQGNVGIGMTAPATTLQVAGSLPTIRIGASGLAGCLEMGNSDGSAGINYITVLNGALTSTTIRPSACQ